MLSLFPTVRSLAHALPVVVGCAAALTLSWKLSLFDAATARASGDDGPSEAGDFFFEEGWEPSLEVMPQLEKVMWMERFAFGDEAEQLAAAEALVRMSEPQWPDDHRGRFLEAMVPGVLVMAQSYQIPASVTLAQGIVESGWGRSSLASRYNNLFGVKARSGFPSVLVDSAEYIDGRRVPMKLRFSVYESWEHCIMEHGEFMSHPRYAQAREYWTDYATFTRLIAPKYASDPNYANHIVSIVREYDLDRWDELVIAAVDMAATAPGEDSGVSEDGGDGSTDAALVEPD